ncbi:MAG: bifunctional diguanylate cyclase/phosphodiesterase, partial [Woeseiaceae bacterium]|nr:bifunctional diguanylate cyclase/phosphodiesterase [Woeseiaceae bacterium]
GDTTLETVAERLTESVPGKSIVGRLAGDEFAAVVDCTDSEGNPKEISEQLAAKLLNRLAEPFFVQGHEVFMTASMGIARYPKDATNVIDLIRNADAALYSAKKHGGNQFARYRPEMNEAAVERLMTKSKLKRAFERDELLVQYQPKYNLETGEVFGAEALVRWELPERGIILPADFIPIAEESSLIIEIGEWVLDKVCEDFRYWQRSVSSPGRVSVNLSLKQLRQANFADRFSSILRGHEVSPTSLELEITETTLMEDTERTIKLLDELYALGLHLAIDDFGTGYSSLSALQQFPISTLKIDQSFVRDVAYNDGDATIVSTIVQMGRNLNMDVVAEGVETEDQLALLQKLGCTYVQGLLFGDPMSCDNYLELLLAQSEGTDEYRALFA